MPTFIFTSLDNCSSGKERATSTWKVISKRPREWGKRSENIRLKTNQRSWAILWGEYSLTWVFKIKISYHQGIFPFYTNNIRTLFSVEMLFVWLWVLLDFFPFYLVCFCNRISDGKRENYVLYFGEFFLRVYLLSYHQILG